jgi:hypothetical protein
LFLGAGFDLDLRLFGNRAKGCAEKKGSNWDNDYGNRNRKGQVYQMAMSIHFKLFWATRGNRNENEEFCSKRTGRAAAERPSLW